MNISGKGRCTVDSGISGGKLLCIIKYNRGWWRWTTILADPITFLILAEVVCRHVLKNGATALKWEGSIGTNKVELDIPAYAMENLSLRLAQHSRALFEALQKAEEVNADITLCSEYVKLRSAMFPDAQHPDHTTVQ